jgi:hypothetical protein
VRIPVVKLIVATEVLPLSHVPPATASVRVIVAPTHTVDGPRMDVGAAVTVMVVVAMQPPGKA